MLSITWEIVVEQNARYVIQKSYSRKYCKGYILFLLNKPDEIVFF